MKGSIAIFCALLPTLGLFGTNWAADLTRDSGGLVIELPTTGNPGLPDSALGWKGSANTMGLTLKYMTEPRLTVTRLGESGWDLEFSYFAVSWETPAQKLGALSAVCEEDAYSVIPGHVLHYTSRLCSGELNLRRRYGDRLMLMTGIRLLYLDESYHDEVVGTVPATVDIATKNSLLGLQTGIQGPILQRGGLAIEGAVKVGVLADQARSRQADTGLAMGAVETSGSGISYLGEALLRGNYQLTENLSLRFGYQFLCLKGVSLASGQVGDLGFGIGGPEMAALRTNGTLSAHGAFFVLELKF